MDFLKPVFLVLALSALSTAAPQGQQCLSCTIDKAIGTYECKDTPRIRYCSEKCSYFVMLGRGDEPNYDKPYIVRGCSTDGYMRKFGCSSRCYNRKHTVGSDEYWVCTFCCTGLVQHSSPSGHRCGIATERRAFHDFNSSFLRIDSSREAVKRAALRNVKFFHKDRRLCNLSEG